MNAAQDATKPATTEEYLAALPDDRRRVLEGIRRIVLEEAPEATDSFGYGMPAFKLGNKGLFWYAAWKSHYSIYPLTEAMAALLPHDDPRYSRNDKGTIRFPAKAEFPYDLARSLVKARIDEVTSE